MKLAPVDSLILRHGDYAGPFGFAYGIGVLQLLDAAVHNLPQNIAIAGWLSLGVAAVVAPLMRRGVEGGVVTSPRLVRFTGRWLEQNAFRLKSAWGLAACTLTYAVGSWLSGAHEAALFGAGACLGNVMFIANEIAFTKQHMTKWFREAKGEVAMAKLQGFKQGWDLASMALRAASYVPLALIDWKHAAIAGLFMTSLASIYRRGTLLRRGSSSQSLAP